MEHKPKMPACRLVKLTVFITSLPVSLSFFLAGILHNVLK